MKKSIDHSHQKIVLSKATQEWWPHMTFFRHYHATELLSCILCLSFGCWHKSQLKLQFAFQTQKWILPSLLCNQIPAYSVSFHIATQCNSVTPHTTYLCTLPSFISTSAALGIICEQLRNCKQAWIETEDHLVVYESIVPPILLYKFLLRPLFIHTW